MKLGHSYFAICCLCLMPNLSAIRADQCNGDPAAFLRVPRGWFALEPFEQDFVTLAYPVLIPQESPHPRIRVVSMPSFGTEWLLELREAEEGGALVLREASSSIAAKWAAVSPAFRDVFGFNSTEPFVDKIEVTERVATISDELAAMVVQAWDEQLSSVCLGRSLGNDGTTYDFSARYRADIRSGHTWSPDAATPAGHLVGIAELLKDFVLAPRSEQKQIAEEISGLAMALKVLEPGGGPGLTTP